MNSVRIIVEGRVQGVGFRAWVEDEALSHDLVGWVRNRYDGTVEAVFSGDAAAVDAAVAACRRGPLGSSVTGVEVTDYGGPALTRFTVLPTA